MKRKVSYWIVLILTMLTISTSIIPHHHHNDGELACFLMDDSHSEQQQDGNCEGENLNCVAHESYLSGAFIVLGQAIPVLLNVIHLEWIPSQQIRCYFDHPVIPLPAPPLVQHQGRRAPPCL